MDYQEIRYEQDGPVTVVTIDRPERMNAIGPTTALELVDAWTRFRDDDDALVGVLTGTGAAAFCAGGDLKSAFAGESVAPLSREERDAHARGERPGILGPTRWTDLHKPTIAALPQHAIRTDKEAAIGGFGRPLRDGLRLEAACFDRLLDGAAMEEGLRRFNERDHPDRMPGGAPATPGLTRPLNDG